MQELKHLIRNTGNVILWFENLPQGMNEEQAAQYIWELCSLNVDPRYLSVKDRQNDGTALVLLHRSFAADYFQRLLEPKGVRVKCFDNKLAWDKGNPVRRTA